MYLFYSGLPRSGSNLLSSILNQNPNIRSEGMSPLADIFMPLHNSIENDWVNSELQRSKRGADFKQDVVLSLFNSYYKGAQQKFIFDKSRSWALKDRSDALEKYFDVKMIVMERDIKDVCKSYIKVHLDNGFSLEDSEKIILNYDSWGGYPIFLPVAGLINSKLNNNGQYLHVNYDKLISNPQEQVKRIYDFCKIPSFNHRFDSIDDLSYEDKSKQLNGMIDVRETINKRLYDVELSSKAEQKIAMISEIIDSLDNDYINKKDRQRAQRFYALNAR